MKEPELLVTPRVNSLKEYFSSYRALVKSIEDFIKSDEEIIFIRTEALEGTDLKIRIIKNYFEISGTLSFGATLIDESQNRAIIGINFSCHFKIRDGNIAEARGSYGNATDGVSSSRNFKEMTALFSPVDDAISQAVANHFGISFDRIAKTNYEKVRDIFLARDYKIFTPTATNPKAQFDFYLRKDFSSQKLGDG
ncbi:MAG TPA: hypothetical protein DCW55_00695 [Candidatus Pacebacteria bacterium]|nr:hypothetical protein [Candidatus Paceibacterota bacterium]